MEITPQLVKLFKSKLTDPVSYRDAKSALKTANGDFGIAMDILAADRSRRDQIETLHTELEHAHNRNTGLFLVLALSLLFNACFIGYLCIR